MNIKSHLEKIKRLSSLEKRLKPKKDFEIWFWTILTAGTNIWNCSLHEKKVTTEEQAFSTIPNLYVIPKKNGITREVRKTGDVSHVDWPKVQTKKIKNLSKMRKMLLEIEEFRDPYIRGKKNITKNHIKKIKQNFKGIKKLLKEIFKNDQQITLKKSN